MKIFDLIMTFIERLLANYSKNIKEPEYEIVEPFVEKPPEPKYLWDTKENTRHSVRVICDEEGLSLKEKNLICAVIQGESGFNAMAVNHNRDKNGRVLSTDWGVAQINDYYWIGGNKYFSSVEEVLNKPELSVRFMIKKYREGNLKLWVAFSSGSYKKYLV